MAEVVPFRGIIYDTARVSGTEVVAPPYDIVTPELRTNLYAKSLYNIIRIDSGMERTGDTEEDNKYIRASLCLKEWLTAGILVRSAKPCFYAYEMEYMAEGRRKKLQGFFGLVKLVELGKGVYPHEETHSKPKVDRMRLLTACEANTSPIFALYNGPGKGASAAVEEVTSLQPYMEALDTDGVFHRLWVIDRESDIAAISDDLSDKAIYIADGHHRYETARDYQMTRREKSGGSSGKEPYDYVLMFLANIADGNLTILPAHRIIKGSQDNILELLQDYFEIETIPLDDDIIESIRGKSQTLGFYRKGEKNQHLLRYRGDGLKEMPYPLKGLDVTILHELILKDLLRGPKVHYEMDPIKAIAMVEGGDFDAIFFLNPTKVEDVERVALASMRMPPKSTYFYPKIMTGFVINSFRKEI